MSRCIPVAIALLLSSTAISETFAEQINSTIPENVREVYPQPDARVEIGPITNPLGIQQITIVFKGNVAVNSECEGEAFIYKDGDTEPFQSVGVSGASGDNQKTTMASVLFPYSCRENGSYRVTIPEGFWFVGDTDPQLSGAFDLYYEILAPQLLSPSESCVNELSEFRLEFPNYDEVTILDPRKFDFFKVGSDKHYPISVSVGENSDGTPGNYILIQLSEPVTSQGEYNLYIQAKAAEGIKYGKNYPEDESDIIRDPNTEVLHTYTISSIGIPAIAPEEGELESFSSFELTVPAGAEFWFVNDKAVSFIYPVNSDGSLAPDPVCRLTASKIDETDKILLNVSATGGVSVPFTPAAGRYALQLGNGLFSGSWNGEFINSASFIYYYDLISSGTSGIEFMTIPDQECRDKGVYNLNGVRVTDKSDDSDVNSLPKGFYIVKGRKIIIK